MEEDDRINYVVNKASKKLGIIRRARDYLNHSTKILLYKSLVLPHIDYCDLAYMCTTEENLQWLQQIQHCACRIILRADIYASIKTFHTDLELPTLKQRRLIHMAIECHNNIHNLRVDSITCLSTLTLHKQEIQEAPTQI